MKTSTICPLTLLACAMTLGCQADILDPGSRVTSLRVLALRADSPYAAPGDTVTLETLSYDPLGRPLDWAWAACENPATSDVEGCLAKVAAEAQNGASPLIARGEGLDSLELTIPSTTLDALPPEALPAAMVGVVSVACPGAIEIERSLAGLPLRCMDETGSELALDEYVIGLKRIFVRTADRNQNPAIERVTFDGEDWPEDEVKEVDPCPTDGNTYDDCKVGKHSLAAFVTPDSFESGVDEFGREYGESLVVQYYATEGLFEFEVRIGEEPETGWAARSGASGSELTLWFVARDNRGGVSWLERRVRVR
ncbi:MAG: hypothetical protein ABW217_08580 [Polyangiaceae bacterium]